MKYCPLAALSLCSATGALLAPSLHVPRCAQSQLLMSLTLRPQFSFFGDDDDDDGDSSSFSADTSMLTSLATMTARDPYKVAQRVLPIISLHFAWSCLVVAIRLLPTRRIPRPWSISWTVHSLTGGVLGLLLAFRTTQAWSRYWSAAQAWADVHRCCHSLARLVAGVARVDPLMYSAFMRHLIALPISLKQRVRGGVPDPREYFWPILAPGEAAAVVRSSVPHLVLLASLSLLVQPMRSKDDGSGKSLAVWGQCEGALSELQAAAAALDLVARLPPPASYSTHTARIVLLWLATFPFILVDTFAPLLVPFVVLAVAWALYSTEELAKLLDNPFGRAGFADSVAEDVAGFEGGGDGGRERRSVSLFLQRLWGGQFGGTGRGGMPEAVPVEAYCDRIVSELQQQVAITQMLQRRVEGGSWAVTPDDLEQVEFAASSGAASNVPGARRGGPPEPGAKARATDTSATSDAALVDVDQEPFFDVFGEDGSPEEEEEEEQGHEGDEGWPQGAAGGNS